MKEEINTWMQGSFVDIKKYEHMSLQWKKDRQNEEIFLVRPSNEGNAICRATYPEDAIWIADRLNFAANIKDQIEEILVLDDSPSSKIKKIDNIINNHDKQKTNI